MSLTTKKTVYRLLLRGRRLREGDKYCYGAACWVPTHRAGNKIFAGRYRRACTPREAALARRLGLV